MPDLMSPNGLFEQIKRINEFGTEYWSARDLVAVLGYSEWRSFANAIERAKISCRESGNDADNHFVADTKMVTTGSGASRKTADVQLSRFACYLIAQNGDPSKAAIADAQRYFAIQTRRQELSDAILADRERVGERERCTREFRDLSGVAKKVGVNSRNFGLFHDAGYKGLYGGLGSDDIKARKGIPAKDLLMDRIGTTELAANAFRLTQAREKLETIGPVSEQQAYRINREVGNEVRNAIQRIGGTMPEDLKKEEHIKEAKKRLKRAVPQIELEDADAKGLTARPTAQSDFNDL